MAQVRGGILFDRLGRQAGPRGIAAARIADAGRVITDNDHGLVAEFLELPHLPHGNRVPQVHVDSGRIDAVLDSQGDAGAVALFELGNELVIGDDFLRPPTDHGELLFDGWKLSQRRTSRIGPRGCEKSRKRQSRKVSTVTASRQRRFTGNRLGVRFPF